MTTFLPNSHACSQAENWDMFKEITRKLYGEASEANQSLQTSVAHNIPGVGVPDVERSFTNLVIGRD